MHATSINLIGLLNGFIPSFFSTSGRRIVATATAHNVPIGVDIDFQGSRRRSERHTTLITDIIGTLKVRCNTSWISNSSVTNKWEDPSDRGQWWPENSKREVFVSLSHFHWTIPKGKKPSLPGQESNFEGKVQGGAPQYNAAYGRDASLKTRFWRTTCICYCDLWYSMMHNQTAMPKW